MTALADVLLPPSGTGPGVFVVHPWWGLNQTVRDYGAALAGEGFVVGLADAFEGTVVTGQDEAQGLVERYWQTAAAELATAFETLSAHPAIRGGVGGLGFSFGGFQLLGLMDSLPMTRLVTYYADRDVKLGRGPVLGHFAEDDPFADDQDSMIAALNAAGGPSEAVVYPGTRHWFAEKDRPEFDAPAAKAAFESSVAFLRT